MRNGERAWRILLWSFGFVLLVLVVVPIWHSVRGHSTKDYWVWYQTGQTVLQGGEIYPDRWHKFPFMYPPSCALFLAPISVLGQTGVVVVLALVNAAAWICCIIFSVRLATGEWRRARLLVYLVPSLVMGAHVWGNFLLGQPSLVLLALMLGAFILLQRKFQWRAGGLIAVAAAIKAFPVIAIVYLVYRRYWIAVASLVVTLAFLLIVLPIPFRGYAQAKQDLERWSSGMLFKYDETGVGQRLGRSTSWKNQSIWGVANRLLRHVEYDHKYEPHEPVYANFADLDFDTVNRIILACALALGLVFIRRDAPRRAADPGDRCDRVRASAVANAGLHAALVRLSVRVAALSVDGCRATARDRDNEERGVGRVRDQRRRVAGALDPLPGDGADLRECAVRDLAAFRWTGD